MYRVGEKKEPIWVELMAGVRVQLRPIDRTMARKARRASANFMDAPHPDPEDPDRIDEAGDVMTRAILSAAIMAWEGIADSDGAPLPVTPDAIAKVLDDPILFDLLDTRFVLPWALEKNGLAPSHAGILAGATPDTIIAASAAARATQAGDATNVRTDNMPRKQKRAKASGTS